jgi:hypothetical protein
MKVTAGKCREPSHEEVEIANELWCVLCPDATPLCRHHRFELEDPATAQAKDRDMWFVMTILLSLALATAILV